MKHFSILVVILLFMISCNLWENQGINRKVVISGKVIGYKDGLVDLYIIYSQPGLSRIKEPVVVDDKGHFKYFFEGSTGLDAKLLDKNSFANINFIYHPGDSIHVEFNPNNQAIPLLETIIFSGNNKETNNQITKFQILHEKKNLGYGAIDLSQSYSKRISDFIGQMDSLKKKQLLLVSRYSHDNELTPDASKWINSFALKTYYYFLDNYASERQDLPKSYYDYNQDIFPITSSDLVGWQVLTERINSYWRNTVKPEIMASFSNDELEQIQKGKLDADSFVINYIDKNISDDFLSQLLLAHYYNTLFEAKMIDGYKKNQPSIEKVVTIPYIKDALNERYLEAYNFINQPNEFTDEVLSKVKNTPVEETLAKILADNKGKVIYLDTWATWCGPCIKAMPDSKKLISEFQGKNVVFVYVCIDSKEKLWKSYLSELDLQGGQHYLMNYEQSKFFRNAMNIQGIPAYFLFDKNGNIVDQGSHLHPGAELTAKRISKLL